MNGPASTSGDDLAYVRALAERGAHAPLLGGRFMIWWGALLTAAYVAHYLGLSGRFGQDGRIFAIIWPGFSIVGMIGHFLLVRSIRGKAGAGSAGNLASRSVWVAAAFAIGAQVVGSAIAAANGAGPATFDWVVPVAFAVYACALVVTGSLAANRTVVAAGAGAVLMVGLFTALILHPDRYLVAAAGVALTVFLPGILLLMAEPKDRD
jgi:hypothetical protein